MDLNRLFLLSKELQAQDVSINKYTYWAYKHKFGNYRIMTLQTLMDYESSTGETPPKYLIKGVSEAGRSLVIANVVSRQVTQLVIRSLKEKRFQTMVLSQQLPYGIGTIDQSKEFVTPVVVVEGVCDRDAIYTIYPNVVACLTSSLTKIQLELVCSLTNTVILGYDNDDTGNKSYWKDKKTLEERGVQVYRLNHPVGNKDPGDSVEKMFQGDPFSAELDFVYYKTQIRTICSKCLGGLI